MTLRRAAALLNDNRHAQILQANRSRQEASQGQTENLQRFAVAVAVLKTRPEEV